MMGLLVLKILAKKKFLLGLKSKVSQRIKEKSLTATTLSMNSTIIVCYTTQLSLISYQRNGYTKAKDTMMERNVLAVGGLL